jgi:hypothetical protein
MKVTTAGELKKALANLEDDTVLFFKATMGGQSGSLYPVEELELVPGDPPILELRGPRSKAIPPRPAK